MHNIHEQINELIAALKENTAALKGAAVQTEAAPKKARAPKVETPAAATETPAPEKPAETPKVEEKKPDPVAEKPTPAPEATKPGVLEFRAAAQKLLDAGEIAVVRGLKEKYKLEKGASSAVGTEHEDAVWAELQAAIAKLK